jgi:hypothetical protein
VLGRTWADPAPILAFSLKTHIYPKSVTLTVPTAHVDKPELGETRSLAQDHIVIVLWETQIETRDSEARKQRFIVPAQTQQIGVQTLSPKNKGVSPYVPLQAGYRGNKNF